MRLDVWLTNNLEASYPTSLESDDRKLPIAAIYGKVLDCDSLDRPVFMGAYDSRLPGTVEECVEFAANYRNQGIDFVPWGVSRGVNPRAEGDIAGIVAKELATPFLLDLEDGDLYWRGDERAVQEWIEAYSHHASTLWVSPDARPGHPGIQLEAWIRSGIVTRWLPQAYWTDFGKPWKVGITDAYLTIVSALRSLTGVTEEAACARVYPVFPGNAVAFDLEQAVAWSQETPPFGGFSVWHRGTTPQTTYASLAALPDWQGPLPFDPPRGSTFPPNPSTARGYLLAAQAAIEAALREIP